MAVREFGGTRNLGALYQCRSLCSRPCWSLQQRTCGRRERGKAVVGKWRDRCHKSRHGWTELWKRSHTLGRDALWAAFCRIRQLAFGFAAVLPDREPKGR